RIGGAIRIGLKIKSFSEGALVPVTELAVVPTPGQLKEPAPTKGPTVTAGRVAISVAVCKCQVCNRFLIRRVLVCATEAIRLIWIVPKVAVCSDQTSRIVVETLDKSSVASSFLAHLGKEVNQARSCVEMP
ncbi:MAG: hypothetical protein V4516_05260, partial [Pseudomonadota bacterium]